MFGAKLISAVVAVAAFTASAWAQGRGRAAAVGRSHSRGQSMARPAPHGHRSPHQRRQLPPTAQRRQRFPYRAFSLSPGPTNRSQSWYYGYYPYYQPYGGVYPSYGWSHFYPEAYWSYGYYAPYSTSPYFPYLYFYDLYQREALDAEDYWREREQEERARQPAPAPTTQPGARPAEGPLASAPLAPQNVFLTLDGQELPLSPSGGPVLLGSGHHTLRIAARPGPPAAPKAEAWPD